MEAPFILAASVVLFAYTVIFVKLMQLGCSKGLSADSAAALEFVKQWILGDPQVDEETTRRVELLMNSRRERIAVLCAWAFTITGAMCGTGVLVRTFTMSDFEGDAPPFDQMLLPQTLMTLLTATVLVFERCILNKFMLPVVYCACMIVLCWTVSPLGPLDGRGLPTTSAHMIILSLSLAGLYLDFSLLWSSNLVMALCASAGSALATNPAGGADLLTTAFAQISICLWKSAVLFIVCSALKMSARREVEVESGECHTSAVMSLLDMQCDTVVDLNSELALKTHSRKLAGVLMHDCSGRSLQGVSLTEFVAGREDRAHFCHAIHTNSSAGDGRPAPGLFSTYFHDASGNRVKLAVYHVPYRSLSGGLNHLVGLRDDSDSSEWRCIPQDVSDGDAPDALRDGASNSVSYVLPSTDARPEDGHLQDDFPRSGSRSSSTSPSSNNDRDGTGSNRAVGEALVAEVLMEEGLPIILFTRSMKDTFRLFGDKPFFDELLVGEEGGKFRSWLNSKASLVREGRLESRVMVFGRLPLRTPPADQSKEGDESEYFVKVFFPSPAEIREGEGYKTAIKVQKAQSKSHPSPGRSPEVGGHGGLAKDREPGRVSI